MVLIGLTGTHGAGKGTVVNYLVREHGFTCLSVSEFLAAEAERRGMQPDRHARHDIANEYRARGPLALMEAVLATVPERVERVILEPQYTEEEVRFVQERGGMVIAVDADLETRYERVHVRGSAKDDVSFEEFKASQEAEMAAAKAGEQNLQGAMVAADVHLQNNSTIEAIERDVHTVLQEHNIA